MKGLKVVFLSEWGLEDRSANHMISSSVCEAASTSPGKTRLKWAPNPYKQLLAEGLAPLGVSVEEYKLTPIFLPKVSKVIGWGNPGILHLHSLHVVLMGRNKLFRLIKLLLFIAQVYILKISGTRTVWTVHEWSDKLNSGNQEIPATHAKILGKVLDAFITHCETTQNEIRDAFSLEKQKVFVVPHGNYVDVYENKINQSEARQQLNIPSENVSFLLFGSIYRYKGVLEAIYAFKQLNHPHTSLIIAGNPKEADLKDLIDKEIDGYSNILFVPQRIPEEHVQIYMNASDCVLVPYTVFTTSGVAILAMSFGRACIAPKVGFFSDMLDEVGSVLYDVEGPADLLDAMKQFVSKKNDIDKMGIHNRTVAEQWNWSVVAKNTYEIYRSCLNLS